MVKAIEDWVREMKEVKELDGGEELPDSYKVAALKCLLVGKLRDHIELNEGGYKDFGEMLSSVMRYAHARRIEHEQDHMDCNGLGKPDQEEEDWTEEQWWNWENGQEAGGVNAFGKGKGYGKGGKGGYGKGGKGGYVKGSSFGGGYGGGFG